VRKITGHANTLRKNGGGLRADCGLRIGRQIVFSIRNPAIRDPQSAIALSILVAHQIGPQPRKKTRVANRASSGLQDPGPRPAPVLHGDADHLPTRDRVLWIRKKIEDAQHPAPPPADCGAKTEPGQQPPARDAWASCCSSIICTRMWPRHAQDDLAPGRRGQSPCSFMTAICSGSHAIKLISGGCFGSNMSSAGKGRCRRQGRWSFGDGLGGGGFILDDQRRNLQTSSSSTVRIRSPLSVSALALALAPRPSPSKEFDALDCRAVSDRRRRPPAPKSGTSAMVALAGQDKLADQVPHRTVRRPPQAFARQREVVGSLQSLARNRKFDPSSKRSQSAVPQGRPGPGGAVVGDEVREAGPTSAVVGFLWVPRCGCWKAPWPISSGGVPASAGHEDGVVIDQLKARRGPTPDWESRIQCHSKRLAVGDAALCAAPWPNLSQAGRPGPATRRAGSTISCTKAFSGTPSTQRAARDRIASGRGR